MKLYDRDFRVVLQQEMDKYNRMLALEGVGQKYGRINHYNEYPEAIKHYLSLFPNNHIVLYEFKKRNIHNLNLQFQELVHKSETNERGILRFINHNPQAYHIIGSVFNAGGFRFGHHDAYLFPEFPLGNDYRADYLLVGKGSGGYQFVFIELENPNGYVTLADGNLGQVIRGGENQILDWKEWVDANFHILKGFFDAEKSQSTELPQEFYRFDSTRMHYVVVGGTREDYSRILCWIHIPCIAIYLRLCIYAVAVPTVGIYHCICNFTCRNTHLYGRCRCR